MAYVWLCFKDYYARNEALLNVYTVLMILNGHSSQTLHVTQTGYVPIFKAVVKLRCLIINTT